MSYVEGAPTLEEALIAGLREDDAKQLSGLTLGELALPIQIYLHGSYKRQQYPTDPDYEMITPTQAVISRNEAGVFWLRDANKSGRTVLAGLVDGDYQDDTDVLHGAKQLWSLLEGTSLPTETDRIVRLLGSDKEDDNRQGLSLANGIRKAPTPGPPAPPPALTPDEARVVRAMRELLARSRHDLKDSIASKMQKLRVPGSQPELVECAQANDWESAPTCVDALEAGGDPANIEGLLALLTDPKNKVTFFEDDDTPNLQLAGATLRATSAMAAFGEAAIPPLGKLVSETKQPARELALQALEFFDSDAAALAAAPGLTDENRFVRFDAAIVIAKHPKHKELLRPMLDDPGPGVRRVAREALGLPPEPRTPATPTPPPTPTPPAPPATDATSHGP